MTDWHVFWDRYKNPPNPHVVSYDYDGEYEFRRNLTDWHNNEMGDEDELWFFQALIDCRLVERMDERYRKNAAYLIEKGLCKPAK